MDFVSFYFYVFLMLVLISYYGTPRKSRWLVLLAGSLAFLWLTSRSKEAMAIFLCTVLISYGLAMVVGRTRKKALLWASVAFTAMPLLITKHGDFVLGSLFHQKGYPWIVPLGLSFFTMQMIAYIVDVYQGRIHAEKNVLRYTLFIAFFPQLVQGPIPRYSQMSEQLFDGHLFDERGFCKGLQLIIWGFFLKLMIADKAAVVVDTIFGNVAAYRGCYVLVGGILFSIQLYTDFLACVSIAQGSAGLFGIQLADNFRRPYLATSVQEFWGRWHISLSTWLRDYVYIPMGGSRRGKLRRYVNLAVTFAVSGLWHGAGYKYVFWGMMHAAYQIAGSMTAGIQDRLYNALGMPKGSMGRNFLQRVGTFFWVMLAWVVFRADSLHEGIGMLSHMAITYNPWILFDDSLFQLGLPWKEWLVLAISLLVLAKVGVEQERHCVRDWILLQPLAVRWSLYIGAILAIMVYGTYGFGFDAKDFIYGGF